MSYTDQLHQAQTELAAARQAVAESERAKVAPQERLQRAEHQVKEAQKAARSEQWQADVETNRQLVNQCNAAMDTLLNQAGELVKMLQEHDLSIPANAVAEAFKRQQAHADSSIGRAVNGHEILQELSSQHDERDVMGIAQRRIDELNRNHAAGLTNALNVEATLSQWIADSPDTITRRLRRAVAYALTGELLETPPDFNGQRYVDDMVHGRRFRTGKADRLDELDYQSRVRVK